MAKTVLLKTPQGSVLTLCYEGVSKSVSKNKLAKAIIPNIRGHYITNLAIDLVGPGDLLYIVFARLCLPRASQPTGRARDTSSAVNIVPEYLKIVGF